jgi:ubiquinone/menaquinone biosynthesis C-methylase UbiE
VKAAQWTPFLLPHLHPDMSLLDCGCGVGSITLDLAEIVAALARTLLFHRRDPLAALKSIRRVVASDGVAAIADDDDGAVVYSPNDPTMQQIGALFMRIMQHNGADLTYSRHLRGLLLQAGFARTEGLAVAAEYSAILRQPTIGPIS